MAEFKKGDKIRMKVNCSGSKEGREYILVEDDGNLIANCMSDGKIPDGCSCEHNWELINDNNKNKMATGGYIEKAEALNAENLEKAKIERIARMLGRKEEEKARYERIVKDMDAEIARLETATLADFNSECCEMPRGSTTRSNF